MVSYLTLRRVLGILGVLLPPLVVVGCFVLGSCTEILDSVSAYYGTEMRDVFVSVQFALAWFLFSYRGYERKDDIAGDLACLFFLGVALFPTTSENDLTRIVHSVSAAGLFLTLSYFSLFLFTKTTPGGTPTPEKRTEQDLRGLRRNHAGVHCFDRRVSCASRGHRHQQDQTRVLVGDFRAVGLRFLLDHQRGVAVEGPGRVTLGRLAMPSTPPVKPTTGSCT